MRRVENGFQTRDKLPRILQEREHLAWWHFLIKMPSVSTFFQVELEVKSSSNEKKIVCRNSIPNPEALIDEMTVKTSKKNDCHQEDVKISRCSVCVCEPKMAAV